MRKTILRKLACIGLLVAAAAVSACGSANKVAVVDVQKVQQDSAKIQAIQKEITDKNAEIQNRLTTDSQAGLSDEDMQKKVQEAQQERMIFVQSKQKQIQSMVETQSAAVAKEKNIAFEERHKKGDIINLFFEEFVEEHLLQQKKRI